MKLHTIPAVREERNTYVLKGLDDEELMWKNVINNLFFKK